MPPKWRHRLEEFLGDFESGKWEPDRPLRTGAVLAGRSTGQDRAKRPHAVPAEVAGSRLALAPPQSSKPQYAGVVSAEGDYFLIEVDSVQGGELASMPQAERAKVMEQAVAQAANAQPELFHP